VSAPAGRTAAVGAGLLAKLLAAVRPEFRVEVYVPASDDPVLGRPSCVVPAATGRAGSTGFAAGTPTVGARAGAPTWWASLPTPARSCTDASG
jgi:hypothetical protein